MEKKPLCEHTACMENRQRDSGQQGRMKIRHLVLKGKKPERLEWSVPEIFLQHVFVFSAVILQPCALLCAPFPPLMVPFSVLLGAVLGSSCLPFKPKKRHLSRPAPPPNPCSLWAPRCYLCHSHFANLRQPFQGTLYPEPICYLTAAKRVLVY